VANLIDCYLDHHVRMNRTQGSHAFFTEQLARLRAELDRKEEELRDLKSRTGVSSLADQRELMVARVARLEDALLSADTARAASEAKVRALREESAKLPSTVVTAEIAGSGDQGTDMMRDRYYALQMQEKGARAIYTPDHPKMRDILEQLEAARKVLDEEERTRKEVTTAPNPLYEETQLALLAEEPALASLQAQTDRLQIQLAQARDQLKTFNENELRITKLQREIALNEADFRKYAASVEQACIDRSLEAQRMSNISIVQPASYEPKPVRPRKALNLGLGMLAAMFGGVGLALLAEYRNRSLRTAEDLEKTLALPTLISIPRMTPDKLVLSGRN